MVFVSVCKGVGDVSRFYGFRVVGVAVSQMAALVNVSLIPGHAAISFANTHRLVNCSDGLDIAPDLQQKQKDITNHRYMCICTYICICMC